MKAFNSIDFDSLPTGPIPMDIPPWPPGTKLKAYANYDRMYKSPLDSWEIGAKWCSTAQDACDGKGIEGYVYQSELKYSEHVKQCETDGSTILLFTIEIANGAGCLLNPSTLKPVGYEHRWCSPRPPTEVDAQESLSSLSPIEEPCDGFTLCKRCRRDGTWTDPSLCG